MQDLNLPLSPLKVKNSNGKTVVFDELRKKNVVLTPEEWVRQQFVHYLIKQLSYPKGRIGIEIEMLQNGLSRRCDAIVYNGSGEAVLIIEFKAPSIKITQQTFDQIFSYNLKLKVPYLMVSNGLQHFCCKYTDKKLQFLKQLPMYKDIV